MSQKQIQKQNSVSIGKILLGVLAGAAAGAALGILFAPDKGLVSRKKIVDRTDDLGGEIKLKFNDSIKTLNHRFENAKDKAKGIIEKVISSVEEGYNEFKNADHHDTVLPKADLKL